MTGSISKNEKRCSVLNIVREKCPSYILVEGIPAICMHLASIIDWEANHPHRICRDGPEAEIVIRSHQDFYTLNNNDLSRLDERVREAILSGDPLAGEHIKQVRRYLGR